MDEKILCFESKLLGGIRGSSSVFYDRDLWMRIRGNLQLLPRYAVENDPKYKQLVVYVVVEYGDRFLAYRRNRGDERLEGMYSIGIGGHVNADDEEVSGSPEELILRAAKREISEEIEIEPYGDPEIIGFINDDSDPVGKVHFGIVLRQTVREPVAVPKSEEIGDLEFLSLSQLGKRKQRFENWSRILISFIRGTGRAEMR